MKKHMFRFIRRKTKKFFSISIEIIFGSVPPPDYEKIKQENLKFLFKTSINWMPEVERLYDEGFLIYHDPDKTLNYVLQNLTVC